MRSAPLFIDTGDDTVATVVSMPDGPPEGLVVVLAGIGRHVVIGGTLAALLAEPLASEGLATLRVDYAGVGDSPGVVSSWTAADVSREAAATSRAVSTVREALGVDRFVSVGTCFGSRVALRLASDPAWGGTVCLAPPILEPGSLEVDGEVVAATYRGREGERVGGGRVLLEGDEGVVVRLDG